MNVSEVVKVVEHFSKERQAELAKARAEIERLTRELSRQSDVIFDRAAKIAELTRERDEATGARPGRLVRGAR